MKHYKLDLLFDWKAIENNACIPIIVAILLIGYSYLRLNALPHIIPALELVFPVFAAWWSIFIFQDILEEPGGEIIFSYSISRLQLGIIRVASFFILYLVLMIIMLLVIDQLCVADLFLPLALQLSTESFFFAGLGFLAMVITLNTGWALTIVVIYSCTQILTNGQMLPFINIYIFNDKLLTISELFSLSARPLLWGGLLWIIAQTILNKLQKYN